METGVEPDQPAVVDEVRVPEVAQVLLDDAGADEEPPSREVDDEPPVLADHGRSIGPHQEGEDADCVDLVLLLSLIHISEPTRLGMISYAVFCLKKKKT